MSTRADPGRHALPGGAERDDRPSAAEMLTVTEAARQAAVPRGVVEGWIANGHLPFVLVDRRRRVRPEDLALVQERALVGVILAWRHDRLGVGMRLRVLRETAGLTRGDLAVASGVDRYTIVRIETGRYAPYAETVRRLARGLQIAPARFVSPDPVEEIGVSLTEAAPPPE